MTHDELEQMIAQDLLAHKQLIMVDEHDIDRIRQDSEVMDGCRLEGRQDEVRELVLQGLGALVAAHRDMVITGMAMQLMFDTASGLMASSLVPMQTLLDSMSDIDQVVGTNGVPGLGCEVMVVMVVGFKTRGHVE